MSARRAKPGSLVENAVNLEEVAAGRGVVWTLQTSEDLNANLARFEDGGGVEEHVNDEVDVILVGVTGSGSVVVDGHEHTLGAGKLVFVPKGSRRSTRSASEGFAYLTVHKKRGPLQIGSGR